VLRKQACFEDGSVGAGDSHNCIVRQWGMHETVLREPRR
jgi:hypothetical protein